MTKNWFMKDGKKGSRPIPPPHITVYKKDDGTMYCDGQDAHAFCLATTGKNCRGGCVEFVLIDHFADKLTEHGITWEVLPEPCQIEYSAR